MSRPNTRDNIFDAALKLLSEKGFNASSVQDITTEAGVPKGSFYNHFESKEALGAEIIEFYGGRTSVRDILTDRSLAPLARLTKYFTTLNQMMVDRSFEQGCLLGNFSAELADQSPLIRSHLATIYGKWTGNIEAVVAEGQADGSIPSDLDAHTIAACLLNGWEGATLRAKVERNGKAFDMFMEVVFRKILK